MKTRLKSVRSSTALIFAARHRLSGSSTVVLTTASFFIRVPPDGDPEYRVAGYTVIRVSVKRVVKWPARAHRLGSLAARLRPYPRPGRSSAGRRSYTSSPAPGAHLECGLRRTAWRPGLAAPLRARGPSRPAVLPACGGAGLLPSAVEPGSPGPAWLGLW